MNKIVQLLKSNIQEDIELGLLLLIATKDSTEIIEFFKEELNVIPQYRIDHRDDEYIAFYEIQLTKVLDCRKYYETSDRKYLAYTGDRILLRKAPLAKDWEIIKYGQ